MENKIDKLNKKIDQYKKDYSKKDKMIDRLQNQNKELIEKLAKQKSKHEKSLEQAKVEIKNMKKQIENLKSQATVLEKQKSQHIKEELKKIIATNKVLNDGKMKLLQIVRNFIKTLVEQI